MDKRKENRTIRQLDEVYNQVANYFPGKLQDAFRESCFFGGGCIYSTYHKEEPKDYDIFCEDIETLYRLKDYLVKNKLADMVTDNAVSFNDGKFQLVTKFHGEMQSVIEQFDFKHNMFGYKDKNIYTAIGYQWLDTKYLRFNDKRTRDVASSITRVPKFVARGFICTRREMSKMVEYLLTKTDLKDETRSVQELINNRGY